MNDVERLYVESLLANPDNLLKKKPFYREIDDRNAGHGGAPSRSVDLTETVEVKLPNIRKHTVSQGMYMQELDVHSHRVLFDENVPSITVKAKKGGYVQMEQYRMAVPFQVLLRNKQVRHLCVNAMTHTLLNPNPTDKQQQLFIRFKQAWCEKNMEGAKTQFVQDQKSYADAALLFFIGLDNKLHTKNINYEDGYVIITHKNDEGKHVLECLYYATTDSDGNSVTYLDCYDDEKMTRFTQGIGEGNITESGWFRHAAVIHGFSENPLVTKRGLVAWERGQRIIESYEALYNTFIVIQKRHGWGALYVKGKFNQKGQKIAGAVVLNDTSMDANADAKYLNPPSPQNMVETLELMEQAIMKACGTTFILPKDINISGDASGLAVEMTQELDMATAQDGVIEWQNAANKMSRLFKEGLAIELTRSGKEEYKNAWTDFNELRVYSEFRVWKPKSEEAHNQMLSTLYANGNGGISRQTYIEKNTVSTPDEAMRIKREREEALKEQEEQAQKSAELTQNTSEVTIVTEE